MASRSAVLITMLVFAIAPSTAIAVGNNSAATHTYVRANYALASASEAKVKTIETRVKALNEKLASECPDVGKGSPQNEASHSMSYEVAVALWSVSYGAEAAPIARFMHTVDRIRWSSNKLTRIARRYAASLNALATLRLPDLCTSVNEWKAGGFTTVPATISKLDRRVEGIEPKGVPRSMLEPYLQPADKSVLARAEHLETELERAETVVGFNDWDKLLETLGLNQ